MLYCLYNFYYLVIQMFNLSEDEIQKINKNFDKNNLYIDYI